MVVKMETTEEHLTFFMNHLLNMFKTRWSGDSEESTKKKQKKPPEEWSD